GLSGASAAPGETDSAIQVIYNATGPIPDGEHFQIQLGFPHGLVDARPSFWQIREDAADLEVSLPALVTELHIEEDGSLLVEEYHTVVVEAGALYASSRTIPTRFLDSIENIEIYEGEQRFTESRANCEYCLRIDHTD